MSSKADAQHCVRHMVNGKGATGMLPPLKQNPFRGDENASHTCRYRGGQVDSVGWDSAPGWVDACALVLATVCLLFWSARAGPRSTTVWLVCAVKVCRATAGAFLMHHVSSEK